MATHRLRLNYSLERGETDRTLRIVVDSTLDGTKATSSAAIHDYSAWFTEVTETIARLLEPLPASHLDRPDATHHLEQTAITWSHVQTDVEKATPPPSFLEAHRALATATTLGHATVTERLDGSP